LKSETEKVAMIMYIRGCSGPEVEQLQLRLKNLGFYVGPVDGAFGGGTESAVRSFQRAKSLVVDGRVGPRTWAELFDGQAIPAPAILSKPLAERCLALTGSFETGRMAPDCFSAVTGDFDGQGVSFGVLQSNC
jgi:peptidoglycan hydrolase-like protein with peptidoglycan-binding domain